MLVKIIILNWNRSLDTINCIKSIKKNTTYKHYDVFCIDNGSKKNELIKLRKYCEKNKLELYELKKNMGFAGGNNIGLKKALNCNKYQFLVTLNNDTLVCHGWLNNLITAMKANNRLGSAQSLLLFADRPTIINSAGISINSDGTAFNRLIYQFNNDTHNEEIFGACAAAAIYRSEALQQVGLFDESYFCYMEDVDLAWRLRSAGWKSWLIANSQVLHAHSASSNGNYSFKHNLITRNTIYTIIKNYPFKYLLLFPYFRIILILSVMKTKKISVKSHRESNYIFNQIKYNIIHTLLFPYYLLKLWNKRQVLKRNKVISTKSFKQLLKRFSN